MGDMRRRAGMCLLAAGATGFVWGAAAHVGRHVATATAMQTTRPTPPTPVVPVVVTRDVRYGPAAGTSNLLDVYVPARATAPLPCVVWIHGGAWVMGDKSHPHARSLADRGFVVVSINYRLSVVAPYPAQIYDCKGAVRFLRAHAAEYHIDPDRIGVWGESAGGHLAAILGTSGGDPKVEGAVGGNLAQSSRVQAVCDWFGPTDLAQFAAQAAAAKMTVPEFEWAAVRLFLNGLPDAKSEIVALANPLHYIPALAASAVGVRATTGPSALPPFLILHGDRDTTVPAAQSRILADALIAAGADATFHLIPGLGHGFPHSHADVWDQTTAFFEKALGKK